MFHVWVLVTLAFLALVTLYFFNRLVTLRNRCRESWSNVDTELKRRYDLIPNLVAAVKGYAKHEQAVFEAVTAARTKAMGTGGDASAHEAAERPLVSALKSLFAVAEGYPELRASRNFLRLQEELAITEDRIQASRRFYNGNVRDYRNVTRGFPGLVFARMFGFGEEAFFQIDPVQAGVPAVAMHAEGQ